MSPIRSAKLHLTYFGLEFTFPKRKERHFKISEKNWE